MEIFNEYLIFAIGVGAMCLIGMSTTVEQKESQGMYVSLVIYIKLAFNIYLIGDSTVKALTRSCKVYCHKRKMRKQVRN